MAEKKKTLKSNADISRTSIYLSRKKPLPDEEASKKPKKPIPKIPAKEQNKSL